MTRAAPIHSTDTGAKLSAAPVPVLFWPVALSALTMAAIGARLDGVLLTFLAASLMILGGLPHGAFDIVLARRAFRLHHGGVCAIIAAYLAVASGMLALWAFYPVAALAVFLLFSAFHFGEDWKMLDDPLLRAMGGAAIIAIPCIGQPEATSALFVALAGTAEGALLAKIAVAVAPVAGLVTIVGVAIAWRKGFRMWSLAYVAAMLCLLLTPPVLGFFIYFVLLHSPGHFANAGRTLRDWPALRLGVYGSTISVLCIGVAACLSNGVWSGNATFFAADAFRLLSVVAAPHLLLSTAIENYLCRKLF